jgi:hypothetical protein
VRALVAAIVLGALFASPARAGFEQPIRNARYPTAGLLAHREYDVELRITPESSAQGGVRVGVKDRLMVGAFYGVQRLFEADDADFNDHIGFDARLRLVHEDRWPAVAVGFDSQGWYTWRGEDGRYERKSLGPYLVASRNWHSFAGDLSLTAGVNYTLERAGGDNAPDFFGGIDWTIAGRVSLLGDFSTAFSDNTMDDRYGEGGLWVDAGLRVVLGHSLSLMVVFSDLTQNLAPGDDIGRELEIVYLNAF